MIRKLRNRNFLFVIQLFPDNHQDSIVRLFIAVFCFLLSHDSFSQDTIDNFIEQKLESIAEDAQSENIDYSTLLDVLNNFKLHPINLNSTSKEELMSLTLLDEVQVNNLLDHIEKNGKLISIYELQSIDGFDPLTIQHILPYIEVKDITGQPHLTFKEILLHGNHQILSRWQKVLEQSKGFDPDTTGIYKSPNSRYMGSPDVLYERYRFTSGTNVSAGFTAKKDAGELFYKKNLKFVYPPKEDSIVNSKFHDGFKFFSAHLFAHNIGFVKTIAIGDYQVNFGQGLVAWSGIAYRKTADAMAIKKYATGLRPFTSTMVNQYMRGAAATLGRKSFQFTGFFSRNKLDATLIKTDSLIPGEDAAVSAFQTTGYYRTPGEFAGKDNITQTVYGGNASYLKRKFTFGVTGTQTMLSAPLQPTPSAYNQFDFRGKQLTNFSADYSFLLHNLNFFGEAAMSNNGGIAYLNGCIASLDPKLSLSVLHRNIQKNYQSLFINAFAEGSPPQSNEQGLYMGVTVKPTGAITLNAFYDNFIFPWLKSSVNAPSHGNDFLLQAQWTPNKKFDTYIKFRTKDKFTNAKSANEIDYIVPYAQTTYRWNASYLVSPALMFRSRVEYVLLDNPTKDKDNGILLYEDVLWKNIFHRVSLTLRYALFDTKTYDTRIYALEEDVPGAYSIPSYYYKGSRVYVMTDIKITRNIDVWLRWGQTYYSNKSVISSGNDEIDGHTKTDVKAEVRMKF
ncbi:MAG: helix-hairpin-helix domain-containing protein [Bacteroidetes bacterium]|nr:helix-hairpin-helix domain-containing protein [Bacteroidota bacterium]